MSSILIFDSGIGGLTVAGEIRSTLPAADMIYVADDAAFPYGDWQEAALTEHVVGLVGDLIGRVGAAVVVIACNTASTLVLPSLRARHGAPFVGTVPAIKPAAEATRSGLVSVLGTFGTMQREYTRALIQEHAGNCHVRLVGSGNLAPLAEAHMRSEKIDDAVIWTEIEPAFVEREGKRTDVIVLACTHYPFLIERFRRLAPWPVTWIDPAPAIARRVASVAGEAAAGSGRGRAYLTSGKAWPAALAPTLAAAGLIS
ncbi:MAG: glutamate racemase [Bauldia sp.]|nr:glutamate racemase [Bauldia sp.]